MIDCSLTIDLSAANTVLSVRSCDKAVANIFPHKAEPVLSDSATPSNLIASNFLTGKDNITLNPIFGMLSSRAIQNIPDMLGYL